MKKSNLLWVLFGAFVITCLAPLSLQAKKKVDLSTYRYVTTYTDDLRYRDYDKWNYRNTEATILEAIGKIRLQLIENTEIAKMTDLQKMQLLLVRFTMNQHEQDGTITVDFMTPGNKTPVASYRTSFKTAINASEALESATERIIKKIEKDFPPEPVDGANAAKSTFTVTKHKSVGTP